MINFEQLFFAADKPGGIFFRVKTLVTKGEMNFSANCLRYGIHPAKWFSSKSIRFIKGLFNWTDFGTKIKHI